jgi:hypothetical protein
MSSSESEPEKPDARADLRLGQVLVDVGMISTQDLANTLNLAREVGLPVGRVLVMSSLLAKRTCNRLFRSNRF